MSAQLLTTKLHVPTPRPQVVVRQRLIDQLSNWFHGKLTLISAPAGFGKTTLVGTWLQVCERPVAWFSLDEEDSDPTRFFTYFIAALQTIKPEIGANLLSLLQSPQPPSLKSLLTPLLNEIATQPEPFLLVLDDYHVLDNPAVQEGLIFLLDHLPAQMHLVLTTREDPPWPLARLRVRGQMTELRAADLRFTAGEAADFLQRVMGLTLTAEEVAALETRTEGWIAGLQMAALAMQGRADMTSFVQAFTGSHRFVLDYLVEEVLQRQPAETRRFLLETSLLRRLNGSLCDVVTGREGGAEQLEALERGNLFVVPLDDERHWYRYHHLFADVLQARLRKEQRPHQIKDLHQRASLWYEQNNWPRDAIRHALIAPEYERAAALIEMGWPPLFNGYRPATWLGLAQSLPDELVRTRPVLNLGCAYCLLNDGELEGAAYHLSNAERLLEPAAAAERVVVNEAAMQTLPAFISNARAYLAQALRELPATIAYGQRTLELTPPDAYYLRGLAQYFMGLAHWSGGDLAAASQAVADSATNMTRAGIIFFQTMCMATAADIKVIQGRLHEAARTYEQSLQFAFKQTGFGLRETADPYVGLGELHREWNDLPTATKYLRQGKKELADQASFKGSVSRWRVGMAHVKAAEGEFDGALALLHEAEQLYKRDPFPELRSIAACKARIWLAQGKLAAALGWVREQGLSADDELSYLREFDHITLAKILIACYRQEGRETVLQDVVMLLGRLLAAAEAGGRVGSMLEILIQQALAYEAEGDLAAARPPLERALTLAEPEGYVRVFVDEGEPLKNLLRMLQAQAPSLLSYRQAYLNKLLMAFGEPAAVQPSAAAVQQPLAEPLTERELEVLQLLAEGLSNREIGQRLYLSLSTIKGHNSNIYGKLEVGRRTEAIARARELGLL